MLPLTTKVAKISRIRIFTLFPQAEAFSNIRFSCHPQARHIFKASAKNQTPASRNYFPSSLSATTNSEDSRRNMSSNDAPDKNNNMPDNEGIRQQKQALRKQLRDKTKELTAEDIHHQSSQVWQRVTQLQVYQRAKSIGLFLSMPSGEINTDEILEDCVKQGKDIFVPEVGKNFELCDMELRKVVLPDDDNDTLLFHKTWPKNKWKIPEPPKSMPTILAKPGDLDLLIVPGLGFDRNCNRMGQGKGYYDRFIARMTADETTKLPLVAVALTPQLVTDQSIPVAEYDQTMDAVVLSDEVIGNVE